MLPVLVGNHRLRVVVEDDSQLGGGSSVTQQLLGESHTLATEFLRGESGEFRGKWESFAVSGWGVSW